MYCNTMKLSENFSALTEATSERPAYSPALYQIKSAIAKLLVSFQRQVKPRRQRGATVAIGDDSVVAQEWNRDRIA